MLGYFSGEWVFLAAIGLAVALLGGGAINSFNTVSLAWTVAVVSSVAFYGLLRTAGKTPIGITYESHPAARGHPVLSAMASAVVFLILSLQILFK